MPFPRSSGILLHPTSLPGPYGIGDLGPEAVRFVDFLAAAGQTLWQVNPLGPTGYGDSPYSCHSAFAGNPLLISPDLLHDAGLLTAADLAEVPPFPAYEVDFGWVIPWKRQLLQRAFEHYRQGAGGTLRDELAALQQAPDVAGWLPDFALFMALKEYHGGQVWNTWEPGAARHEAAALEHWRGELAEAVAFQTFVQCLFRWQWFALKDHALRQGVAIAGDIPIFVAYDSADVWANRELFELDPAGTPLAVAGVPPDYFSATGQLWGNPLYDWQRAAASDFAWWVERFRITLTLVDCVRLDHFRGFESFWRVPAGEPTAIHGAWVECPGEALFRAVERELGGLPIMAEDLGVITPAVEALRDGFAFPGMKILQFAFVDGSDGGFLPHNYPGNCVVYTGTHDNDTAVGWWQTCGENERQRLRRYLGGDPPEPHWALIRLALASVADTAIMPLQDVLGLGGEARMNCPGRPAGNWTWRVPPQADLAGAAGRLRELSETYGRCGEHSTYRADRGIG
ncbi:MAG: 4-alpha-glucanotransferase [Fimbriimonadaceae bacterium]|nr:4-alpha-glucanotransferase [Fimbriimonadaceae bacterium]